MIAMKDFAMWFLGQLPSFFLSEPIVYIFGLIVLSFVVSVIFRICRIK